MSEPGRKYRNTVVMALAACLCTAPLHAFPLFELDTGLFAEPVAAVEYHHAGNDQYLVTISRHEMAMLDTGVIPGWRRTSQQAAFYAFDQVVRAQNVPYGEGRARPVCRFFIAPASHFLSISKTECDTVAQAYPEFTLETDAAFHAWEPSATGECPRVFAKIGGFSFAPVYRVWNARSDTRHRLTTSKAERDALVAQGWVAEGNGDGVAMCVPSWTASY